MSGIILLSLLIVSLWVNYGLYREFLHLKQQKLLIDLRIIAYFEAKYEGWSDKLTTELESIYGRDLPESFKRRHKYGRKRQFRTYR